MGAGVAFCGYQWSWGSFHKLHDLKTLNLPGNAKKYIIAYAKQTWNCPVLFYTNPKYDSEQYKGMVELLQQIAGKWEIAVIDMWNDAEFNVLTEGQRALYMADGIHPTQAGYLEWWTPYIEKYLIKEEDRQRKTEQRCQAHLEA